MVVGVRGDSSEWDLGSSPMLISHKLPGIVSSSSVAETFPPFPERTSCDSTDRQYYSGGLYQKTGRPKIPAVTHTGTQTDCLEQQTFSVFESHPCSRYTERGSIPSLQGNPLYAEWRLHPGVVSVGMVQAAVCRPIYLHERTLSVLCSSPFMIRMHLWRWMHWLTSGLVPFSMHSHQ